MDLGLSGKAALVCGASAGIGWSVARALAAEGARVAIVSRSRENLARASTRIREETGANVVEIAGDLSERGEPERIVKSAVQSLGALDILVTNAGGPPPGNFTDVGENEFNFGIALTLRSVEHTVRAAIPFLRESAKKNGSSGARIVNLTSITAKEPHDGLVISNTLRPAVHGLSKSLSRELGPSGITVNCVCPGFTRTERLRELAEAAARRRGRTSAEITDEWRARIPVGRLGEPQEIGDVVAFLCSARASFVNGASISVDGGESHPLL